MNKQRKEGKKKGGRERGREGGSVRREGGREGRSMRKERKEEGLKKWRQTKRNEDSKKTINYKKNLGLRHKKTDKEANIVLLQSKNSINTFFFF